MFFFRGKLSWLIYFTFLFAVADCDCVTALSLNASEAVVYVYRLDTSLVNLAVTRTNTGHALELRRLILLVRLDWTELGLARVC